MNGVEPLARIRIVLSHPSHPGNIGASARAMKTMGVSRLYLVNPRAFPDEAAVARASGATDVLDNAVLCSSLAQALDGTVFAAALTARRREWALPMRWPREAAGELVSATKDGDVALVFGTEMSGLSNEDVALCQMPVMVPADPAFSSLNLASAVQILCYELRLASAPQGEAPRMDFEPARFEEIEGFYAHLEQAMIASGFLDPAQPKRLLPRLRRLFGRARLERDEVNILRGIVRALQEKS